MPTALTPVIAVTLGVLISQSGLAVINATMLIGGALTIVLGGLSLRATRRERHARLLVEHRLREREDADRARAAAKPSSANTSPAESATVTRAPS